MYIKTPLFVICLFLFVNLMAENNQGITQLCNSKPLKINPDTIAGQYSNFANSFFPIFTKNKLYNLNNWSMPLFDKDQPSSFYFNNDEPQNNNNSLTNTTTTYYVINKRKETQPRQVQQNTNLIPLNQQNNNISILETINNQNKTENNQNEINH